MPTRSLENRNAVQRRGDLALLAVALLSGVGVYFGHDWFHQEILPSLGVSAPLGDALGGMAIILVAILCQRLASLAIFRVPDFGLSRWIDQLLGTIQELREELTRLSHAATTDKLTGCWNRRHLEAIVPGEIARLARFNHALSLLVIDVDHFKRINDSHGHRTGDLVLAGLAARLQASLRASDSLVRWGGEEFIIFSPNTTLAAAIIVGERSRELICREAFPEAGPVTVSIGVAECLRGESWQQWFERADAALYRAKANGRNQVQAAPETPDRSWNPDSEPSLMVELKWHPAYEFGQETIDREHRVLFSIANELLNSIISRNPAEEVAAMIELLLREIRSHFHHEEELLEEACYPRLSQHCHHHQRLLARAEELVAAVRAGSIEVGELFQFLAQDVIARHMLTADRDFLAYLKPIPELERKAA